MKYIAVLSVHPTTGEITYEDYSVYTEDGGIWDLDRLKHDGTIDKSDDTVWCFVEHEE